MWIRKAKQRSLFPVLFLMFSATLVPADVLYTPVIDQIPYIHGDKVLLQEFKQATYRFGLVDINSKTFTEIRDNKSSYLYPFAFGGSHVAWIEYSIGGVGGQSPYRVKSFDVSTKTEVSLASDDSFQEFIAVDGGLTAWTDYRFFSEGDTTVEVYAHDGSEKRITNQKGFKAHPHVNGNLVVWQDYRNATSDALNADIYLYDMTTQSETAISNHPAYQDQPYVQGQKVVWQDYRNTGSDPANADIYLYDLETQTEIPIVTHEGYQSNPVVYGNIVVWHDYRNTGSDSMNADIYLYDLASQREYPVTEAPGFQDRPFIYGETIVWMDYSDNNIHIARIDDILGDVSIHFKTDGLGNSEFGDLSPGVAIFNVLGRRSSGKDFSDPSATGLFIKTHDPESNRQKILRVR